MHQKLPHCPSRKRIVVHADLIFGLRRGLTAMFLLDLALSFSLFSSSSSAEFSDSKPGFGMDSSSFLGHGLVCCWGGSGVCAPGHCSLLNRCQLVWQPLPFIMPFRFYVPVSSVCKIKRHVPGPHRLLSVRTPVHRECG
jgi:hypothetical protein